MEDRKNEEREDPRIDSGQTERQEGETRRDAAAAGGYDSPTRPVEPPTSPAPGSVQPDLASARTATDDDGELIGGVSDDGVIETQEARENAGPFTGTGNQDALRTSGRQGASDAHAADTRTVEEGAEERTQEQPESEDGNDKDGAEDER